LFEIGVNRKVWFFYGHNSEGSFVPARVVEKSTEKGVEKSRQQGFLVGPIENPIDYRFNRLFSTHHQWGLFSFHRIGRKWSHLKEEPKIMGKPGGQLFSCHSSGEMSLGKCKFSMGDVISEFKSGAKNGCIS
jgi:hypothetical protein